MSNPPSHLISLQLPRRGAAVAGDAVDDVQQPQTATCCTALQRGVPSDGLVPPRYAPLRTLATVDDEEAEDEDEDDDSKNGKDKDDDIVTAMTSDSTSSSSSVRSNKKTMRKCKSTVDELKVSQLIQAPQLRRSVGRRRDWSFENLGNAA